MESYLQGQDLWDTVTGGATVVKPVNEEITWNVRAEEALNALKASVCKEILERIWHAKTPKEAGDILAALFLPESRVQSQNLEHQGIGSLSHGDIMGHLHLNLNEPPMEDASGCYVKLTKDSKTICRTQCINPPVEVPTDWNISDIKLSTKFSLVGLPRCFLRPAAENDQQKGEWRKFMGFLAEYKKAAVVRFGSCEFYILPPDVGTNFSHAVVLYRMEKAHHTLGDRKHGTSVSDETLIEPKNFAFPENFMQNNKICGFVQPGMLASNTCMNAKMLPPLGEGATPGYPMTEEIGDSTDANVKGRNPNSHMAKHPLGFKFPQTVGDDNACESVKEARCTSLPMALKHDYRMEKSLVPMSPSYLKTLSQAHSGWIFGAIAELVDNSRDAKATILKISVETVHSKKSGKEIPMLSVIDDGHGMSHQEIVRMFSLGHEQPDEDDPDHIGRFGIGFKTGAMRLGRDAFVLTQTTNSRSIAFLSQSLNEGKDNVEIPIVSYCRQGPVMEVDIHVQSEALADCHLKAIKEFSPFNEYFIGQKSGLFCEKGTGTQIYIWNLDKYGSDYSLEWQTSNSGKSPSLEGDILIRSRRMRSRPGQISQKVPLDYSLQSYLQVIFLDPRMKIFVQGSLVKSRPLAKSLNKTVIINDHINGKPVQLTLGRCQLEWELMNCGIFLYWHGRLIEAYKRVGGMVHNADMGRGVIGVVDVTDVMNDGDYVWVHSNKQGFQDCEAYAKLEEWLGHKSDEYWDDNFDTLHLKKGDERHKPDHAWVQCDKCRKWRILSSGFDSTTLPQEWFCYMPPYNGKCETPEQQVGRGVITVAAKRSGCDPKQKRFRCEEAVQKVNTKHRLEGDSDHSSVDDDFRPQTLKRLRRGPARGSRKG